MPAREYATIKQAIKHYPSFTEPALRSLIFRAPLNGLGPAIVRLGRRVLIDIDRFEKWLDEHREDHAA